MNPIFITRTVRSLEDLARAVLAAAYGPSDNRPVPRNLDALADMLREARVSRVVVVDWRVEGSSSSKLREMLADEGVTLGH